MDDCGGGRWMIVVVVDGFIFVMFKYRSELINKLFQFTGNVFHATCDNTLGVWIDGEYRKGNHDDDWKQASHIPIPPGSEVIAISCRNGHSYNPLSNPKGLLGSSSTGILTGDSGWVCTSKEHHNWHSLHFDDEGWAVPEELGVHGVSPWNFIKGIDSGAEWIWTGGTDNENIWCRYQLGKNMEWD